MKDKVKRTAQPSVGTEAERDAARADLVRAGDKVTPAGVALYVAFNRMKIGHYGLKTNLLQYLGDAQDELKLSDQTVQRLRNLIAGKSGATGGKKRKSAPTTDSPVPMARLTPVGEVLLHSTPP